MAQHDYVIDNQSAPAFRADLNGVLSAVVSQNSGGVAPTVTFANMLWYDTANKQLKKRNEADSAWITLGTVDEVGGKFTPNSALTVSEISPSTLVTSSETIASNNNDTTIPTSAAVKSYTDAAIASVPTVTPDASVSRAKLKTGTNSGSYSGESASGTIFLDAYSFFPQHNSSGSTQAISIQGGSTADTPAITWSTGSSGGSGTVRWRYILA